jgi:hypothetical protein
MPPADDVWQESGSKAQVEAAESRLAPTGAAYGEEPFAMGQATASEPT